MVGSIPRRVTRASPAPMVGVGSQGYLRKWEEWRGRLGCGVVNTVSKDYGLPRWHNREYIAAQL